MLLLSYIILLSQAAGLAELAFQLFHNDALSEQAFQLLCAGYFPVQCDKQRRQYHEND